MKPLSILFINRVYPPGDGATGHLVADLAGELAQRGHRVTVVTTGADDAVSNSGPVGGIRVERVRAPRLVRASHWRRALGYLRIYPALFWRALRLPRADVIVTLTDPPLLLVMAPLLKWTKRSRLVHWAQDLYPEVAEELGVLGKRSAPARVCRWLSTWAARRHQRIIAVGHCMRDRLLERGLPAGRIEVVPNWTRVGPMDPDGSNQFRAAHHLEHRWVVMYLGNLGLAHPFDALLDAAQRLQESDILFLIVGHGPRLEEVQRAAAARALTNVRFLPPQPLDQLAHSLGAAELHVASMRENLCGLVVPSKVYGILGAGRPCIFLGPPDSEAARVLRDFDCGTVLPSGDGAALARCILAWRSNPDRLREAGRRARQAAEKFSLLASAPRFNEILVQAAAADDDDEFRMLQQAASRTQA